MSNLKARNNFVIIRAEKPKSVITLLKTESYNEKEEWLKKAPLLVYSVGEDVQKFKVGDRVILGATRAARYDYLADLLEDKEPDYVTYFAVKEEDIVAVIE